MSFDIFGPYDSSIFNDYKYGSGYTYRVWIPPSLLLSTTGQFTISIGYYSANSLYLDAVGVCSSAGSEATYEFKDDVAEQVYFSGSTSVTVSGSTGVITSDPIDYILDITNGLIISFEIGASSYFPTINSVEFADCVIYRDTGNFGLGGAFNPDTYWLGTLGGIIAGVGYTSITILAKDLPPVHGSWKNLILESADAGNYCNGILGEIECEAAGGQSTSVIGVLPAIECEATGMELVHCSLDASLPAVIGEASISPGLSLDAKLPAISCEAYGGSIAEGELPAIECEGVIGSVTVGRLDRMLPGIRCEAYCGSRLDRKIPTVSCEATASGPTLCWLDKELPGVTCIATGSGGPGATLNKDIPVLKCEGVISCDTVITLDKHLPGIRCIASGRRAGSKLDARVPAIIGDEDNFLSESLVHATLDAMLPAIIMAGEGYGGDGNGGGSISYRSRFTDYILRYDRWA
jgi:hypothetical protein